MTTSVGHRKLLLCAAYIPPQQPSSHYSDFADAVTGVTTTCHEFFSTIIVGDVNLPNIRWTEENHRRLSKRKRILCDLTSLLGFHQISHVLNSKNIQLDLIFSSAPMDHVTALSADNLLPFENIHPAISITLKQSSCSMTDDVHFTYLI